MRILDPDCHAGVPPLKLTEAQELLMSLPTVHNRTELQHFQIHDPKLIVS